MFVPSVMCVCACECMCLCACAQGIWEVVLCSMKHSNLLPPPTYLYTDHDMVPESMLGSNMNSN